MEAIYGAILFISILINSLSANSAINGENPERYVLTSLFINVIALGFLIRNYFTKKIPKNIVLSTFAFAFISLVLNIIVYYSLVYEPNNRRLYISLSGLLVGSAIVSSIAYIPYIIMLLKSRSKQVLDTPTRQAPSPKLDYPPAPTRQAPVPKKYKQALERPLPPIPVQEPATYIRKYY